MVRKVYNTGKEKGAVSIIGLVLAAVIIITIAPPMLWAANISSATSLLEKNGYVVLGSSSCYPYDFIPCVDDASRLGSPEKRWRELWVSSGSIHLGLLEISNEGNTMGINGQLLLYDDGKVWKEIEPDLDHARIDGKGKPSQVYRGLIAGFSLPVYDSDDEEIFASVDVPLEWDGVTDPLVHIYCYIAPDKGKGKPDGNNNGKRFNLELVWEAFSPKDNEAVPLWGNIVSQETIYGFNEDYIAYEVDFVLDYDISVYGNGMERGDQLNLRIRRIPASQDEIQGEVVITHIGLKFLRDKLGELEP